MLLVLVLVLVLVLLKCPVLLLVVVVRSPPSRALRRAAVAVRGVSVRGMRGVMVFVVSSGAA